MQIQIADGTCRTHLIITKDVVSNFDNLRNEWVKLDNFGGYISSGPLGQGTDAEWGRDYYKIRKNGGSIETK